MPGSTPDLGELLAEAVAFARGSIATAIPATVLEYDPVRQAVTAKPTVSGRYQDPDTGELVPFELPPIANVPVAFPSGGGCSITWPLVAGDTVYLVIADSSLDEWKTSGAAENVPADVRRFDLTDAVAIPGVRPFARPIPETGWSPTGMVLEGDDIRIGSSAAAGPLTLQPALLVELGRIAAAIAIAGGSYVPGVSPAPIPVGDPTLCATTRVKAE